jgi:hypothetical protein
MRVLLEKLTVAQIVKKFSSFYGIRRAVTTQSVEHWATGWTIGVLGFDSRLGLGIFLFATAFRMALGITQLPIQWVPGGFPWE